MQAVPSKPRVLVIDDELGPRESLRMLLKLECEVDCAASVDEGLSRFREAAPDLVILDIRMPGRTGIDGLRAIRALDPLVSVIMLTGYGALETAQEALRLGANDYLNKPFDTARILQVVREYTRRTRLERRRAQAEAEVQTVNRRLTEQLAQRERMAQLGQRSMELAHDMSSPLTAILGYVEMLSEQLQASRAQLGPQFKDSMECLGVIDKSVARCRELLDFWRAQKLGRRRDRAPTDVAACVADLAQAVRPMADEAGVRLDVSGADRPCRVLADGIQVFRALQNIVINAVQAAPRGSGRVVMACRAQDGQAILTVEDNGGGMSPATMAHLFEPYFTTKTAGGGLGLGMTITRSVIEDHGGSIQVESREGQGTRMTVRLPQC